MNSDITTENTEKNVRDILSKKYGTIQTGGKGSVRRKKKKKSNLISKKPSEEEKQFNKIISNINILIKNEVNNENISLWNLYLEDYFFDVFSDLRKKDFKKKKNTIIDIEYLTEHYENILLQYIINLDSDNYMILSQSYEYFKNLLSNSGFNFIINSIDNLQKCLNKKDYLQTVENKEIENVNELYNLLDLDINEIPKKIELKKAYLKKSSEVHPDKHPDEVEKYSKIFQEVNNAYKSLLAYYYHNNDQHLYTHE